MGYHLQACVFLNCPGCYCHSLKKSLSGTYCWGCDLLLGLCLFSAFFFLFFALWLHFPNDQIIFIGFVFSPRSPFLLCYIWVLHLQLQLPITGSSKNIPIYYNYTKCCLLQPQYSEREIIFTITEPEFLVQEGELTFPFLPGNSVSPYEIPLLPCR